MLLLDHMSSHLVATLVEDCSGSSVRAATRVIALESVLHIFQYDLTVAPKAALYALLANLARDFFLSCLDLWWGAEGTLVGLVPIQWQQLRLVQRDRLLAILVSNHLTPNRELALKGILLRGNWISARCFVTCS